MTQDKDTLFDAEFGLNQLSGNRELLIKMLDRFSSDYASFDTDMIAVAEQQDITEGKAKAHTIKGVAGNLGFWNLYHASKELEDIFKAGDGDFGAAAVAFQTSLKATIQALDEFKSGGKPEQSNVTTEAPAEASASGGAMEELITLLEAFEFIDADKLAQLLQDAGVPEDKRPEIEQAINDLDYPAATELLNG